MGGEPGYKTVGQVLDGYLEDRRPHMAAYAKTEYAVRAVKTLFDAVTLEEIKTPGVLREYCHQYQTRQSHAANNTVRKHLSILQSALRWAWKRAIIPGVPLMWIPPKEERPGRGLSEREVTALLKTADAHPTELHLRTFVYLALYTSEQASIILDLQWPSVDFKANTLTFMGRNKNKRSITMNSRLSEVLKEARSVTKSDYIVEWRGKKVASVWSGLMALMVRAGLNGRDSHDLKLTRLADNAEYVVGEPEENEIISFFISYASADGYLCASELVGALEALDHECFIDKRNMRHGQWPEQLSSAIEECDVTVAIITPGAIESRFVLNEVGKACRLQKDVVPVIINNTPLEDGFDLYLENHERVDWTGAKAAAARIIELLEKPS